MYVNVQPLHFSDILWKYCNITLIVMVYITLFASILNPCRIFTFHLLPSPVHPTGFSFYTFPGFLVIFLLLSWNNNNKNLQEFYATVNILTSNFSAEKIKFSFRICLESNNSSWLHWSSAVVLTRYIFAYLYGCFLL